MTAVQRRALPVFVVEDHDEVLHHLYKCIGKKQLPFDGMQLLHFDSHPDLNIPQGINADDVFCKDKLFESLSIENWIVPALYAGHFNSVVWVKCEWANEIPDGTYPFYVGRHRRAGELRVSLPFGHFVSELAYASPEEMDIKKEVTLHVITWYSKCTCQSDYHKANETTAISRLLEIVRQPYVLDVDMDFFSTRNPLTDLYTNTQLELLRDLYVLDGFSSADSTGLDSLALESSHRAAAEAVEKRRVLLDNLHQGLLQEGNAAFSTALSPKSYHLDANREAKLLQLVSECRLRASGFIKQSANFDWDQLHEHGCTFDSSGLPHHVSSPEVVERLAADMKQLLLKLPSPVAVTVARSSADDYCPKDQVDIIQELLLNIVQDVLPGCSVKMMYH